MTDSSSHPWGARAIRFYDLDGHIVELSEPMLAVVQRMLTHGLTVEAVAQWTGMPIDSIHQIATAKA